MEDEMKRELNALKQVVADLAKAMQAGFEKIDARFEAVQVELGQIKGDLADVKSVVHRTAVKVTGLAFDVDDLKRDTVKKKDLAAVRNEMTGRFDGFAKLHRDLEVHWAAQGHAIDRHDKRLTKLEARRA